MRGSYHVVVATDGAERILGMWWRRGGGVGSARLLPLGGRGGRALLDIPPRRWHGQRYGRPKLVHPQVVRLTDRLAKLTKLRCER